jgi:hypothetical protein
MKVEPGHYNEAEEEQKPERLMLLKEFDQRAGSP